MQRDGQGKRDLGIKKQNGLFIDNEVQSEV